MQIVTPRGESIRGMETGAERQIKMERGRRSMQKDGAEPC